MASFNIALLFPSTVPGAAAGELIERLGRAIPAGSAGRLELSLPPTGANLHFTLNLSPYPRSRIEPVQKEVLEAGGTFIELWHVPPDMRAQFLEEHLPQPIHVLPEPNLELAARQVERHLNSMGKGGKELRKSSRYDVQLDVEFATDMEFVREHAINISNGGVFVATSKRPEFNSIIMLKLRLPNGTWLETPARVAHIRDDPAPGGVGLSFAAEDDRFQEQLDAYLAGLR